MSNSKQTSNRSKIRAGQTYYRVVNIMGKWEMQTLRPNGVKFPKLKLSRSIGHIRHTDCNNIIGYGPVRFDPKNVFYGQTAEQLAENNFVPKVVGKDRVSFSSTAFIRKPNRTIECLSAATQRSEDSQEGETFYTVVCMHRESKLSYDETKHESTYVETGYIRGGKETAYGGWYQSRGVFYSKRDAARFLKEILDGQHPRLCAKMEYENKQDAFWFRDMEDEYFY